MSGSAAATAHPLEAEVPERQMGYPMGMLFAFGTLIVFAAVVGGALLGAGALLHHLRPNQPFDEFYALHRSIVVGVLIALSVLWVLPPHPWSKKPKVRRTSLAEASTSQLPTG